MPMAAQPSHQMASVMADSGRILDSLSTSVLIVDAHRSLLYLNVSAETLFGVSRNQVRGRPLAELLQDSAVLDEVIDRAATTSRPFSRRELPLRPIYWGIELFLDCIIALYGESGPPGAVLIEFIAASHHQRITREKALLPQIGGRRFPIRQIAHGIK